MLGPDGEEIVGAEEGGRRPGPAEHLRDSFLPGGDGHLGRFQVMGSRERQVTLAQRGEEAGPSLSAGLEGARPVDDAQPLMAQRDQVLGDEPSTARVVDRGAALVAAARAPIEKHDGNAAPADLVDERRGLLPYRRHQDPGHPLLLQQAELAVLTGRRAGRAAEDQEVVGLVGGVLDAARQRREEGVVDVEDDEPDGLVSSSAKLAGRVVPDEADVAHGLQDSRSGLFADELGLVDDVRRRPHGHAGELGNVTERQPLHLRPNCLSP